MENVPCMTLQAKPLPTLKEQGTSAWRLTGCCWREAKTLLRFAAATFLTYIPSAFACVYPFSTGLRNPPHPAPNPASYHPANSPWKIAAPRSSDAVIVMRDFINSA